MKIRELFITVYELLRIKYFYLNHNKVGKIWNLLGTWKPELSKTSITLNIFHLKCFPKNVFCKYELSWKILGSEIRK